MQEIDKSGQSVSGEISRADLLEKLISGEENINDCLDRGVSIKWDEMIKVSNDKKEEVVRVFVDWAVNNEFNLKSYMTIFSPSEDSKNYGIKPVIDNFNELKMLADISEKFNPLLQSIHKTNKELKKYQKDFYRGDFLGMKIGNDVKNLKVITDSVVDEALKNIKKNDGYICAKTVNDEIMNSIEKPTPVPPLTQRRGFSARGGSACG